MQSRENSRFKQSIKAFDGGRLTVDVLTLFGPQKYVKSMGGQGKGENLLFN